MKALIRNREFITEPWDQWTQNHIEWVTTPRPEGDGYTLVENYTETAEETIQDVVCPEPEIENEDNYVVINGVRYSKEELRSLIE